METFFVNIYYIVGMDYFILYTRFLLTLILGQVKLITLKFIICIDQFSCF